MAGLFAHSQPHPPAAEGPAAHALLHGPAIEVDKDGITFTPTVTLEPVRPAMRTTNNMRIAGLTGVLEFRPLAMDVADVYALLPNQGFGVGLGTSQRKRGVKATVTGSAKDRRVVARLVPVDKAELWVLRSTLKDEATDTTLAPGEGISSDHTFRLRHQQRAIVIHVPLSYQLSPLDVGSLDLSPGRTGTVESLSVATTG
jgi:hypothetical protein